MEPIFFSSPDDMRSWLEKNHLTEKEVLVGFYKKHTGKPTVTWPQSVDEALCFGWIDGIRKSIDEERYTIRFTPRKLKSNWSAVNLKRIEELIAEGRVKESGLSIYQKRDLEKANFYSFEREQINLSPDFEKALIENANAWTYFQTQSSSYRKQAILWVMSAKQEATRQRRMENLIECCAERKKIKPLNY